LQGNAIGEIFSGKALDLNHIKTTMRVKNIENRAKPAKYLFVRIGSCEVGRRSQSKLKFLGLLLFKEP
jgi:hypothetical protein